MSRESIANRVAAKTSDDELAMSLKLDHSLVDSTFRSFAVLEEVYSIAVDPDPVEVWPRFRPMPEQTE